MTAEGNPGKGSGGAWYRRAFSYDYLWLYSHRSKGEAERQIRTALKFLPYEAGQKILDLACGTGRHMRALVRRGARATGVDLSKALLKFAREEFEKAGLKAEFVNEDMRRIAFDGLFDGAMMWFTSFGYFAKQSDDLITLKNLARALKPGGWWWVDLPNPSFLRKNLIPRSDRVINGPYGKAEVHESRNIRGERVQKVTIINDGKGERIYRENVRLYRPEQFGELAKKAGLTTEGILGDYDGGPLTGNSPRQIWFGKK